jgi:hypothetical protein
MKILMKSKHLFCDFSLSHVARKWPVLISMHSVSEYSVTQTCIHLYKYSSSVRTTVGGGSPRSYESDSNSALAVVWL